MKLLGKKLKKKKLDNNDEIAKEDKTEGPITLDLIFQEQLAEENFKSIFTFKE